MPLLTDTDWPPKHSASDGPLLKRLYVPVLAAAERYDRTTGYFSPAIFVLALRGVEGLVLNRGRMRLVVGCTFGAAEVAAIEQGTALRDTVAAALLALAPPHAAAACAVGRQRILRTVLKPDRGVPRQTGPRLLRPRGCAGAAARLLYAARFAGVDVP